MTTHPGASAAPSVLSAAALRAPLPSTTVASSALVLAGIGIVLDQATKVVAEQVLTRGEYVAWLGSGVGWQLVFNPGAAFGLPAPPWVFLIVTALVVGIVARALPHTRTVVQGSAYALLLSGAIGNLLDRLLRAEDGFLSGEVVDFIAWGGFPRFNLADTWITVGFALLVVALWTEERGSGDEFDPDDLPAGYVEESVQIVTDPGTPPR